MIDCCVDSSFLCEGFLQLRRAGATLHRGARASHYRGLSCCGAQAPDAQAQQLWLTGPAATRHVGSSQTRARTRVPYISRQILNHCATREALILVSLGLLLLPTPPALSNVQYIHGLPAHSTHRYTIHSSVLCSGLPVLHLPPGTGSSLPAERGVMQSQKHHLTTCFLGPLPEPAAAGKFLGKQKLQWSSGGKRFVGDQHLTGPRKEATAMQA